MQGIRKKGTGMLGRVRSQPGISWMPRASLLFPNASRTGAAALELVLGMPVLLALIVGIIWLGTSVVAQCEVTVEARHKAWSKRTETTGTALLFLKDDVVSDDATHTVDVSPMFDGEGSPESEHDLMVTAWDHESLPLDKVPNWKQYALAAANAKTGSAQVAYTDASNKFTQFKSQAASIWSNLGANVIAELGRLGSSVESALNGGKNDKADQSRERAKINQQIVAKQTELRVARRRIRTLDEDASDALRDVLKNKIKRLQAEIDDLKADRRALD